jgi:Macro domain
MIEITRGDLLKADVEALVNTVNCVGVMGPGIAAQFKHAYPKNFDAYQLACKRHEVQPGRMCDRRNWSAREPPEDHQLPDEAPLARQKPDPGHRDRTCCVGRRCSPYRHQVDRDSSTRMRPGWPRLVRGSPSHRTSLCRVTGREGSAVRARQSAGSQGDGQIYKARTMTPDRHLRGAHRPASPDS